LITSQLQDYLCHEVIGEKTIAEEILDRTVPDPHRVKLKDIQSGKPMTDKKKWE
jgi:hypothetical protein